MGSCNGGTDSKWGMGSEEEEEDYDPQYRLFLQNLKADKRGTGYTLHVERSNGTVIVKYEDEDEDEDKDELKSQDELKRKNPMHVSDCPPREAIFKRKNPMHVEKDKDPKFMGISRGIARELPAVKRRSECFHMGESHQRDCVLTKSGSFRRQQINSHQTVVDERSNDLDKGKRLGSVVTKSGNFRRGRINSHQTGVDERSNDLDKGKHLGSVVTKSGDFRRGRINSHQTAVDERSDDLDEGKHLGSVVSRRRGQLNSVPPEQLGQGGEGKEKVCTLDSARIEKDYYAFLSSSVLDGYNKVSPDPPPSRGRMTPQPSNKRLAPSGKRVPPNTSEAGSVSEFRQGAMDILLKPYDIKEHVALLKTAKGRTALLANRELRGGRPCPYRNESVMGSSYLDNHKDLKKKIRDAQRNDDQLKVLLLLRGLFYYIQHVCMDGQFVPWNDNSWLEAMNKSTT